ncbi:MAG: hypothetical protein AAB019_06640 [Planctomycetota bacterium]
MKKNLSSANFSKDFEMALYESVVKANDRNRDALVCLGYLYTKEGLHAKALEIDKKLVTVSPEDAICHYNMTCSYSNLNMLDEAFKSLEMAVLLGYSDFHHMEKDPDLRNLRNDPRYQQFIQKLKNPRTPDEKI